MRTIEFFLFGALVSLFAFSADAVVVTFNDAALESHVRGLVGIPTGDIMDTDVNAITGLVIANLGVSDLTGLEFFISLNQLYMNDNSVTDLSPLSGLNSLLDLNIKNNPITDLSSIASLSNLASLRLGTAAITPDFTSINAMSLSLLEIDGTSLSDINVLTGSTTMQNLKLLNLGLTDISAVSLFPNVTRLTIENNNITDISALSSLNSLQFLFADGNQITDLSPLNGLPALQNVQLEGSPIASLAPLASLPSLDTCLLENTGISDLLDLSNASSTLRFLAITDNTVSDLTPLSGLTGLEILSAALNDIVSLDGLEGLTNLATVNLINNDIADISPLVLNAGIGAGDTLSLQANPLSQSAKCNDVPTLRDRGAGVFVTQECDTNLFPCPLWPTLDQQGDTAYTAMGLDWMTDDVDSDGIPDRWQARLVGHVACQTNHALNSLTIDTLALNLGSLAAESSPAIFTIGELNGVRHVISSLILMSDAARTSLTSTLNLSNFYVVVDLAAKTADEPFSGSGDLDNDGTSNLDEYLNVIANSGGIEDFVFAATSPNLDGSEILPASNRSTLLLLIGTVIALGAFVQFRTRRTPS